MLPLMGAGPSAGGESYAQKVLSYSPIAYWLMNETSGTTAVCSVNAAQNGTYARNVTTMGTGTGIGDGNTAPTFDGTNDYVDIYSTTFRDAFSGALGSNIIWAKVYDAGVWGDATNRYAIREFADTDNYTIVKKDNSDDRVECQYKAGSTYEEGAITGLSDLGWMFFASTWTKAGDAFIVYKDGSQVGSTFTGLGTWANNLSSTDTVIGSKNTTPIDLWYGGIAHAAVFDKVLTPTQILDLATV